MMISTKGRYALRVMLDLADHNTGEYIPLKDIAQRQEISVKYLENILASLSRANLVDAIRGKGGGYRLCRAPEAYAAGEIIRLAEGSLATVSCLKGEKNGCEKAGHCRPSPCGRGWTRWSMNTWTASPWPTCKKWRRTDVSFRRPLRYAGGAFLSDASDAFFIFPIDFICNSWYPSINLII